MSVSNYVNAAQATSTNVKHQTTVQTQPIPGREADMAKNNAGGFTFTLDMWGILDRFLMIGSESAGYYVGAKETTAQSFVNAKACIAADGVRVVNRLMEYSLAGRAPKNDPAIVVLALCAVHGNEATVTAAYDALPKVCRIGTHLFLFVSLLDSLGKWNAAAKRGVAKWYTNRGVDKLAVQLLKYQQRNGWAHRDVLRLAHVKPQNDLQSNLFRYAVKGELPLGAAVPQLLIDFEYLKRDPDKKTVLRLIQENDLITWEMLPTKFMKDPDVLEALLENMGITAVIRKLGALSAHGVIAPMSTGTKMVLAKLNDVEMLKKGRVHPLTVLQAMRQYMVGHGEKGSMTWKAEQQVVSALDNAFYSCFATAEKTDENYLVGVDISGSMFGAKVNGSPNLTAAEVAAVMAMAAVRNQPNYHIVGFKNHIVELKIGPTMRLDAALNVMRNANWNGGATDCAKAFEYAKQNKIPVDKVITITDNETYAGTQAPSQALNKLRQALGKKVSSVVIGTSVSAFTIADPKDPYSLDIAGFDSAAPQIIAQLGR